MRFLATAAFSDEDKKNGDPRLFAWDKTYRAWFPENLGHEHFL